MKVIIQSVVLLLAINCVGELNHNDFRGSEIYNFRSLIKLYIQKSGKHCDVSEGLFGRHIRIRTDRLNDDAAVEYIETELEKINIQLFEIGSNRVVACWADPVDDPIGEFISLHKKNGWILHTGFIGEDVLAKYEKILPLKDLKEEVKVCRSRVQEMLDKDEEYQQVIQEYEIRLSGQLTPELKKEYSRKLNAVYDRMWKNSDYANAMKDKSNKERLLGITVYEYIVADYKLKGLGIPPRWYQWDAAL